MRRAPVRLAAWVLGLATTLAAPAPLRNEDVVRMVLDGLPAEAIVKAIETSPAAFDLSPEMLDELRLAKVPQVVLDAMKARTPTAAGRDEAPTALPSGRARLTVALRATGTWTVPPDVADVAIFLACTIPRHAPSPWRSATPLGEDFTMPRHEMLAFAALDRRADDRSILVVPPSLGVDVDADADEVHDLVFGVATRRGARWSAAASVRLHGVRVLESGVELFGGIEIPADRPDAPPRLTIRPASTPASTPPPPPS